MVSKIKLTIECKDPIIKTPKISGKDSTKVTIPLDYKNKEISCIPVNYKFKLPKKDKNGIYKFEVNSNEIYTRFAKEYRKSCYFYLPIDLLGVDILIFSRPENNYEVLNPIKEDLKMMKKPKKL